MPHAYAVKTTALTASAATARAATHRRLATGSRHLIVPPTSAFVRPHHQPTRTRRHPEPRQPPRLPFASFYVQPSPPLTPTSTRATMSTASTKHDALPPAPCTITQRFQLPQGPKSYAASAAKNEDKLRAISRDFRSDTLTVPTDSMFEAMALASRGDDVYLEDETTAAFEESIALLLGKEAALFLSSGTLSNQLAIRAHLGGPPHQMLLDARAHINRYEAGAAASLSGVACTALFPTQAGRTHLSWEDDVRPNLVLEDDVHLAPTRLVCLENTMNGCIFPQDEIVRICDGVRAAAQGRGGGGVGLHLDGARLWNVAAETGRTMAELAAPFDSVSLCLSKGLGAPMGTVLVGSKPFIHRVRHLRKMYGGGLRQTGAMVAAARVAVEEHLPRLRATHEMRAWLSDRLEELGVRLISSDTNMIFFDPSPLGVSADDISKACKMGAYLPSGALPLTTSGNRLVIHHQTSPHALADLVEVVRRLKEDPARVQPGEEPARGGGGQAVYGR